MTLEQNRWPAKVWVSHRTVNLVFDSDRTHNVYRKSQEIPSRRQSPPWCLVHTEKKTPRLYALRFPGKVFSPCHPPSEQTKYEGNDDCFQTQKLNEEFGIPLFYRRDIHHRSHFSGDCRMHFCIRYSTWNCCTWKCPRNATPWHHKHNHECHLSPNTKTIPRWTHLGNLCTLC